MPGFSRLLYLSVASYQLASHLVRAEEDDDAPPPPPPEEEEVPVVEEEPPAPDPEPEPVVKEEVPPPPPPPPPPAAEPEPVKEEVKIMDQLAHATVEQEKTKLRRLLREKVEENQKMKASGHHWMVGSWLYGDLAHGIIHEDHLTAHGCADHCEANSECYHWVFYLDNGRCDLKVNGGGHNADVDHMIVGHAKRYLALASKKAEL